MYFSSVDDSVFFDSEEFGEIEVAIKDYKVVNNGIGHYEFWGHPCYDNKPDVEVGTLKIVSVNGEHVDKDKHKHLLAAWDKIQGNIEVTVEEIPIKCNNF